jgi:hypothetical protein
MTLTASLRAGFSAARQRPKLIALLWAVNALLALTGTQALRRWLQVSLDPSPAADELARRFSFALFMELIQDSGPALTMALAAVGGALLLGFLVNPLLAGGTLEVLGSHDDRSFLHRFFRGGGHFYGRFLRLLLLSTLAMVVVGGLVGGVLNAAVHPLRRSGWEPGPQVAGLVVGAGVLTVLALFWMALDYARIQVSREDGRRMWRALVSGLRFTLRYRGRTFGLLGVTWLLLLVLLAAFVAFRQSVPSHTAGLIALMVLAQQAFMLARSWLRVATLGAERELHLRLRPAAGVALAPVPPEPWTAEPAPAAAATLSLPSESPVEDPPPAPELSRAE